MKSKIDLRISAQTKESLTKNAQGKGIKVSELVRQIIEDYCNRSDKLPTSDKITPITVRQEKKRPTNNIELSDNKAQIETKIETNKTHPLDAKAITLFKKPYNELNFNQKLRIKA